MYAWDYDPDFDNWKPEQLENLVADMEELGGKTTVVSRDKECRHLITFSNAQDVNETA